MKILDSNFFEQNILCNILHNDKNIFFTKHEKFSETIEKIKSLKNNVILICGNSDRPFTAEMYNILPKNVSYVFATNCLCSHIKNVFSIPIGIESVVGTKIEGHGIPFEFAKEKHKLLKENTQRKPLEKIDKIYCNFNIYTNPHIRYPLFKFCQNLKHFVCKNNISQPEFYSDISKYKATLCPIGNGIDTVRTWEVLYCGGIPIIFGSDLIYKDLLKNSRCVFIEKIEDLKNKNLLNKLIQEAEKKPIPENIYIKYWIKKIKNLLTHI